MSKQNLILNVLTFNDPVQKKDFAFFSAKKQGCFPVSVKELPENINELFTKEELTNSEYLYTDFQPPAKGSKKISVNFVKSARFAKKYYSYLIYQYFKNVASQIQISQVIPSFIFTIKKHTKDDYGLFHRYSLKVQIARITDQPELVISYANTTKILKKDLLTLNAHQDKFNLVVYDKQLYKLDDLIKEKNPDRKKVLPY